MDTKNSCINLKVGITRHTQIPTRWIDQGATQGLPILKVKTRQISGLIEVELAKHIADKTNWRTLLKGDGDDMELVEKAKELLPLVEDKIQEIRAKFGDDAIEILSENITSPIVSRLKRFEYRDPEKEKLEICTNVI